MRCRAGASPSATRPSATHPIRRRCLIMGLSTQMVAWHEDFCRELAGRGLHVVRFDNRDVGHSTHLQAPAADDPPAAHALQARRQLHARGHGRRRGGPAERARARAGARDRRVDGRHDRPDARGAPSAGGALAGVDHVEHWQPAERAAGAASVYPIFLRAPAARARGVRRPRRAAVRGDRLARASQRDPARSARCRRAATTATTTPPARRDSSRRSSPRATARRNCARITAPTLVDARHRRPARAPSGGRATARAIPGAKLMSIDGHGPRPAARRVAED